MIVAEVRVVPVGAGSSMEKTVEAVREALDDCDVRYEVGPVATTLEATTMEDLLETIQCCEEAAMLTAPRVVMSFTLDHRRDEQEDMDSLRQVRGGRKPQRRRSARRSRRAPGPRAAAKAQRRAKAILEGAPRTVAGA